EIVVSAPNACPHGGYPSRLDGNPWESVWSLGQINWQTGLANRGDVTMVCAAASAQHGKPRHLAAQTSILLAKFRWIARVERGRRVEFRVAERGRVGAKPAHARAPRRIDVREVAEMRGMGAVHHEIGRRPAEFPIHGRNRFRQAFA